MQLVLWLIVVGYLVVEVIVLIGSSSATRIGAASRSRWVDRGRGM